MVTIKKEQLYQLDGGACFFFKISSSIGSIAAKAGLNIISTDFSAQRFLFFAVGAAENAGSHAYVAANGKRIPMAKSAIMVILI